MKVPTPEPSSDNCHRAVTVRTCTCAGFKKMVPDRNRFRSTGKSGKFAGLRAAGRRSILSAAAPSRGRRAQIFSGDCALMGRRRCTFWLVLRPQGRKIILAMRGRRKLKYRLFRASNGTLSFWRWEVHQSGRASPLESGTVYGTVDDAKSRAEVALLRLRHASRPAHGLVLPDDPS